MEDVVYESNARNPTRVPSILPAHLLFEFEIEQHEKRSLQERSKRTVPSIVESHGSTRSTNLELDGRNNERMPLLFFLLFM